MAAYYSDDVYGSQMDVEMAGVGDDDDDDTQGSNQSGDSSQESAESAEAVRRFFTATPRFRYIRTLATGSSAAPMLFSEHEVVEDQGGGSGQAGKDDKGEDREKKYKSGRMKRRIVVKSAAQSTYDGDVRNEKRWMDALAGSEHLIASIDLGLDTGVLKRQMVVMEYVANGDLTEFSGRMEEYQEKKEVKVVVPNRVLWRFFLCLTRAVIGMAYPQRSTNPNFASNDGTIWREEIPEGDVTPTLMIHGDMHFGNLLLGDVTLGDEEHDLTPILKLTDFGESRTIPEEPETGIWTAVANQIGEAAVVIMMLGEVRDYWDNDADGDEYRYPDDDPNGQAGRETVTLANTQWAAADVSPALKAFVYWCLDTEQEHRPTLKKVLETCQTAVRTLTDKDFGNQGPNETDAAVRAFIQKFVYDADSEGEMQAPRRRDLTRSSPTRRARRAWRRFQRLRRGVGSGPPP
ncbi:hypothetical protein SLS62_006104 [Diatrype stigma]|uniref:Protein kinase domain-containing protein n=1 Tax=Diatrype stigma TaxID=117547 RepID=A0AAN9UQ27_9PEZI